MCGSYRIKDRTKEALATEHRETRGIQPAMTAQFSADVDTAQVFAHRGRYRRTHAGAQQLFGHRCGGLAVTR